MSDKEEIHKRFVEITARALDAYDQQRDGRNPTFDHERWKRRYIGRPWGELSSTAIEFNTFKPFVDMMVSQLMMATDDEEWTEATKIVPGLAHHTG